MRSFLGGLLGLCLGLAALPQDASARADARASVQTTNSSRAAVASRPATARSAEPRTGVTRTSSARPTAGRADTARLPAASASRSVGNRSAAARPVAGHATAANSRLAFAPRAIASSRAVARSGSSRHAVAVPYSRNATALSPRQLRQTAMASCTTRNGRRVCAPAITRTASMRWTGGLAPAAMSQAGCPDGTIATMAFGHNDITRCVPL